MQTKATGIEVQKFSMQSCKRVGAKGREAARMILE